MTMLDLDFVRKHFPGLKSEWTFMDNAGGSQILQPVIDRMNQFFTTSNVQLGASYHPSELATNRVAEAQRMLAQFINAADPGEVIMGSSTSMLLRILAMNLGRVFEPGDEIIVTNSDHEANIGGWRDMERWGMVIKTWKINPDTFTLELEDLSKLMTSKTRLVAFTHCSNILGTVNPAKKIVRFIHDHGAMACIDAVAYAPHRKIDVQDLDTDFYVFSFYKTYGPHNALLYGKKERLLKLPGNNHFFIGQDEVPYKFQPGHVNFEIAWGMTGLTDYIHELHRHHFGEGGDHDWQLASSRVYRLFQDHEHTLTRELLGFLSGYKNIKIIGSPLADPELRVPTISFVKKNTDSRSIITKVDKRLIGIRYGDFYARRLVDELGLSKQNGVVRISLVHYNTIQEVQKLLEVLKITL